MARTKVAAPVVDEVDDDELEALDEVDLEDDGEEEAAPKKKRTRKAKAPKVEPEGMTTKEVAAELGITPVKLRRILRTDDFFNDKGYTRYHLSDAEVARLREAIAAGTAAPKRTRKAKAAKTEAAAEEVTDELNELEDLEDEDSEDEELDLEDEDEEEV